MDAHHLKSDAAHLGVYLRSAARRYHFDIWRRRDHLSTFICRQMPWIVLAFGGLVSVSAAWMINGQIEREARAAFQMHALDFQSSVAGRLRSYEDILFGIAGLYRQNRHEVTQDEFETYAESLDLRRRFPALIAVNFAHYVHASERERFIAAFRSDVAATAKIAMEPNLPPDHGEYMVVTRTYPANASRVGLNLMTTAYRASSKGFPPLSSAMYLPDSPVSSGLPVLPYSGTTLALGVRLGVFNREGTRSRLAGTAGLMFSVEQFFKEALPAPLAGHIAFRLDSIGRVGGTTYAQPVPVFSSEAVRVGADPADLLETSFTVPFGGALLRIEMSEDRSLLVGGRDRVLPFAVLAGGLLLFGMAGVLSRRTLERNRELTQEIAVQTADLHREVDRAKQLERELAHVVEEERRRIGHELHDDLGQRLTGMSLSFKALSETLHSVSADLSAQAEALERTTSEAISSVRGLAHGLMPVPAGPAGLMTALEQLAVRVSSVHTVRCVFDFDDPVDIGNDTVATNLYRIAQEAVNNAVRHARATVVKILLDEEQGKISLTVRDNGVGFPRDRYSDNRPVQLAGAGLRIMAYRASVIDYRLTIESSFEDGTTIKVQAC
jgi:signal transduction histidine kinase